MNTIRRLFKTVSTPIKGLILGILCWTFIVVDAWVIYQIPPEGWEAAGFFLLFLGFPSTMLISFFNVSVFEQVLLMSLFGYCQWSVIGFLIGKRKVNGIGGQSGTAISS